jgi:P-type E1-E2 ATPase
VVLVVCADDIAIAIPLAYLGAIGAAARHGVIIKGAAHLEALGKVKVFVFDKTGTLTRGTLAVSSVAVAEGRTEAEVLRAGALADRRSQHPLARAVVAYADAHGAKEEFPDEFEQVAGRGNTAKKGGERIVIGKAEFLIEQKATIADDLRTKANACADAGQSVSFVAVGGAAVGFFAVADELKPGAKHAIAEIKELGVGKVLMLTGDNERVAKNIAARLRLDGFHANLLPADKVALLKKYRAHGGVAMVGDGVNDAAALSAANVGIAMGGMGIDAAIESAEVVLMRDDLQEIAEVMHLAHTTHRIALEDFWIWGITNTAGLALVFGGVIGPIGAAAYNFISDFFPLLNSARVRIVHQARRRARMTAKKTVVT